MPMYRITSTKEVFVGGISTGEFREHIHTFTAETDQGAIEYAGMYQRENSISFADVKRVFMHFVPSEDARS